MCLFISYTLQTSWLEHMGIYLYIEITKIGESEVLWKPWWFCMTRSIIATKNGSWSKGFLELHVLSSVLLISHVDFYCIVHSIHLYVSCKTPVFSHRTRVACRNSKTLCCWVVAQLVLVCLADHPWPQAKKQTYLKYRNHLEFLSFQTLPRPEVPSPHDLNRAIAREGLFGRGTEVRGGRYLLVLIGNISPWKFYNKNLVLCDRHVGKHYGKEEVGKTWIP